jgi:L-cystine uptake protein TcyP (sodium:dicarboxylate symporter family)
VAGHDDEGAEFVMALGAVVLQGVEGEAGVGGGLEEAAAVRCNVMPPLATKRCIIIPPPISDESRRPVQSNPAS